MERSLGVRLGRSFGLNAPRRAPAGKRTPARSSRSGHGARVRWRDALRVPMPARARVALESACERRRLRLALMVSPLVLAALGGGWLWLRSSPLVAVEHVQVDGLSAAPGQDAGAIEAALRHAAQGMSTMDVHEGALRAAVASFPIVRSVHARASFPHSLRIEVVEQPPVAVLVSDGAHTALAADGVVLGVGPVSGSLPVVRAPAAHSSADLARIGHTLRDGRLRQMLSVLGAAPVGLAKAIERVYSGSKGITIALRGGVLAYFGDAERPHAKWLSLVRVLADPSSRGASYVDVRLPERPAAGFPPGVSRPDGSSEEAASADPSTAAALAAGLDEAVGGGAPGAGASAPPTSAGTQPAAGASNEEASAGGATPSQSEAAGSETGSSGTEAAQESAPSGG